MSNKELEKRLRQLKIEDFILLENGSEVILKRINGDIYTYIQKGYETDFPFGLLEKEIKVI